MRNKYIIATLLALLASEMPAQRLFVSVTVDNLNSDKMIAVGQKPSSQGFKKLLESALIYQNASYPFSPVDRASAIAAIMTGATPYYNGITGVKWLDTSTLRPASCVAGDTPGNLLSSTFTDELKVGTEGQSLVFSIANHKDAAILSAGHAADAAFWRDEHTHRWKTSSYYSKTGFKWLSAFDALNADEGNFNIT
ncbi:MAG: alkaline phosphatase family protein [Bacteroidales bacterium]|nr:alkaline phosphatase family protein [Bacteroidales bacterium]